MQGLMLACEQTVATTKQSPDGTLHAAVIPKCRAAIVAVVASFLSNLWMTDEHAFKVKVDVEGKVNVDEVNVGADVVATKVNFAKE